MMIQIKKEELQEIRNSIEDVFSDMSKIVAILSVVSHIDCTGQEAPILITDTSNMAGMIKEMIEAHMERIGSVGNKLDDCVRERR